METRPAPPQEAIRPKAPEGPKAPEKPQDPREATAARFGQAQAKIKEKQDSLTDEDAKKKAEKALEYTGEEVNRESSDALQATLETLDAMTDDPDAQEQRQEIGQYVRVKTTVNGEDRIDTVEDWRARLQAATPEERQQLEQEGLFGFVFPADQKPETPAAEVEQPRLEADYFKQAATTVRLRIEGARRKGEEIKGYQQLLAQAELAVDATGDGGALWRMGVLKQLEKLGITADSNVKAAIEAALPQSNEKLGEVLTASGYTSEEVTALKTAGETMGMEGLMRSGMVGRAKGLEKFIFGEENSERAKKALEAYFGRDKVDESAKNSFFLIMLLLGATTSLVKRVTSEPR